ncbi:hypothetical protein LGQ02_01600 [Bacillus shivajii]|uniref:hypothetical protein n=1 Tax=Bacillus shivajii TaxID=1983719 RepID=UPI001CFB9FC8|nr:hypothetical protein [Bacillus shivajii]UCZ53522.1 hypothetical protein LGQ02_01600 [Bacillus shivajii]
MELSINYLFSVFIPGLLFWWALLLIIARIMSKVTENSWAKDLMVTFIQSIMILLLMPILFELLM